MRKENPEMRDLIRQGFRYKKELGQNFLFNAFILEQIAGAAGFAAGDVVIEAGAGAGSLTAILADRGAKVKAVELDRALIPYLRERFKDMPDVEILQGDIMKLGLDALAPAYKICANLPYHISTSFITMAFRQSKGLEGGAVLLQKEVADKIIALPGQDGYGLLALASAWYGEVRQVMAIEKAYFTPRPPVDSTLIAFRRQTRDTDADEQALWLMIRGLFNQRRKNLANGFKSLGAFSPPNGKSWTEAAMEAGIDPGRRPDTLSLDEFVAIIKAGGY